MAHVPVDTHFWDSDEAVKLGELLGDRDAWKHVVRLWAWGLDINCESGVLRVPPWKISEAARWTGDPEAFVSAMKSADLLVDRNGGLYMRGWSRMKRFFKEKKRLQDARRRKKNADASASRTRTTAPGAVAPGHPSLSPSLSLSPSPHIDRERDTRDAILQLHEVEQLGFKRCGALAGADAARMKALEPRREEVLDALKTPGNSWKYMAKVITSAREEASRPAPPGYSGRAPPQRESPMQAALRRRAEKLAIEEAKERAAQDAQEDMPV